MPPDQAEREHAAGTAATAVPGAFKLTRRTFLALCLAGCTQLNRRPSFTPRDETWALLSDIHIHADLTKHVRGACMADNLRNAVRDVLAAGADHVIINGDVAYLHGEPASYPAFAGLIAPLRAAGLPLHFTVGNHDDRARMVAALGLPAPTAVAGKVAYEMSGSGLQWLMLDSLERTGQIPGSLGAEQREWLAAQLDARPRTPTIVVLHHHPQHSPIGLQDAAEFLAIVQPRRQVKLVLFGHTHEYRVWQTDGLHFVNLPALGYRIPPLASLGWLWATFDGRGAQLEFVGVTPRERDHGATRSLAWRSEA